MVSGVDQRIESDAPGGSLAPIEWVGIVFASHAKRAKLSLLAIAAAATAAVLVVPTGASAADPAGTVELASGNSAYPSPLDMVALTPGGLVYSDFTNTYVIPSSGAATVKIPFKAIGTVSSAGDMLLYPQDAATSGGPRDWLNTATFATGVAPSMWQAVSPTGGIWLAELPLASPSATPTIHLFSQDIGSSSPVDLGAVPVATTEAYHMKAGPGGVLIDNKYYVTYGKPGYITLDLGSLSYVVCTSLTTDAAGCRSSTGPVSNVVVRLSLLGKAPVIIAQDPSSAPIVVNSTTTFWAVNADLFSSPADGGPVTSRQLPSSIALAGGAQIGASDSAVYYNIDRYGIYRATNAASAPELVVPSPFGALRSGSLAIGPAGVAWADDSVLDGAVWSRQLSVSGGSITVGAKQKVGNGDLGPSSFGPGGTGPSLMGSDRAVHISGIRTSTGVDTAAGLLVSDGQSAKKIPNAVSPQHQLSGTRVLYLDSARNEHVYNLVTGADIDLAATYGAVNNSYDIAYLYAMTSSLWGDYVSYVKADSSVWRKNLADSSAPVQLAGPLAAGTQVRRTLAWGDWVAWTTATEAGAGGAHSTYRNAKTLDPAVDVVGLADGVSVGGLEVVGFTNTASGAPVAAYTVQRWGGGTPIVLPSEGPLPVVSGSLVAWAGAPSGFVPFPVFGGTPKVAQLPHVVNQPRSLGNPFVGTALSFGSTWSVDQPVSANLTTCSVQVRNSKSVVVRTLDCDASAMTKGEVMASWDGRDGNAEPVLNGSYTWTVTASNGDGVLLAPDGSTAAASGTITLTGSPGPVVTPTPTPSPTPTLSPIQLLWNWIVRLFFPWLAPH